MSGNLSEHRKRLKGVPDNEVYDAKFYLDAMKRKEGVAYFGKCVSKYMKIGKVIDLGCGSGIWLAGFHEYGIPVMGVDFSVGAPETFVLDKSMYVYANLEVPGLPNQVLDFAHSVEESAKLLIISVEVAEHIHAEHVHNYIKNMVRLLPDLILFTAAKPGQIGRRHHTLKPKEYWLEKFHLEGYIDNPLATSFLASCMMAIGGIPAYYRNNLIVLEQGS